MKKILILVAIIFATITINAQDYNKWAISGEFGNQKVADESALQDDEFYHIGLGVRYNINDIVGVGLTGGYDATTLFEEVIVNGNSYYDQSYDLKYSRINLEGYLNTFKAVDLYSKRWTLLLHGGPGISFIKSDGFRQRDEISFNHKETVLNLRGGASVLYKLSKNFAAYGDFSTTSNVRQKMKFDGSAPTSTVGMSANVSNISIGLIYYLGKKDKNGVRKEHADWYITPPVVLPEPIVNNIINNPTTIIKEKNSCDCEIIPSEFVFFDHDKDIPNDINGQGDKNAIFKVFKYLVDNPTSILLIRGYASPTSSSDKYNMDLSNRRAKELTKKFVAMGISIDRIKVEYFGKDIKYNTEYVHDVARRVELIVKK